MLTDEETKLRNRLIKRLKSALTGNNEEYFKAKKLYCNKKQFTKKEAESILNYIKKHKSRNNKRRKEVRIYHCPMCNTYHLTKQK